MLFRSRAAGIFTALRKPLALYQHGEAAPVRAPDAAMLREENVSTLTTLEAVEPVESERRVIGYVVIRSSLADLYMLDGRTYRDRQVSAGDYPGLVDPGRSMLGARQEAWLLDGLRRSQRAGTAWRPRSSRTASTRTGAPTRPPRPSCAVGGPRSGDPADGAPRSDC